MSGLYTKNNLSETGLNAVDAVQKLYAPQVQQDLSLFAFSSSLQSSISSPAQIRGLINQSIADSLGNVSLRTKFLTESFTFSDENIVWLEQFSSFLDKRQQGDPGSSIIFSTDFSIPRAVLVSSGERYEVRTQQGSLVSLPSAVNVRVRGVESGSQTATVQVTVNADGTISDSVNIITPGSGYKPGELLELVLSCVEGESESSGKCLNYTANSLYQVVFDSGDVSSQAVLRNVKYVYRVRSADSEGFFLYNDLEEDWVYLGDAYDSFTTVSSGISVKRIDELSSQNLVQLFKLDGRSQFFSYQATYQNDSTISTSIRNLLDRVEELRDTFKEFTQNNRPDTPQNSDENVLGLSYNIVEGKNLLSNYRIIFRDPDSVLDDTPFSSLTDSTRLGDVRVPGIWVSSGTTYRRVFSTDDKPYYFVRGKKPVSPAIYNPSTLVELPSSGSLKYSISASYAPAGETAILGFDSEINTLNQNISPGGLVYHRTLATTTILSGSVTLWPLFSYTENGSTKEAKVLAI
jgi:hypothetical protein